MLWRYRVLRDEREARSSRATATADTSGATADISVAALLSAHAAHHTFYERRECQHHYPGDEPVPEDPHEERRQRLDVTRVVLPGQLAGQVAAERKRQE